MLFLMAALPARGQISYEVGFRVINTYDVSRKFDTTRTDSSRFRPIKIDLFYPARLQPGQTPLHYVDFLNLYANRFHFDLSPDSCRQVGRQLADYLSSGLGLAESGPLRKLPMQSTLSLPPTNGAFPLVIYFPGMNGMSYENVTLLEQIAAKGYWVAAVNSNGKDPGYMTMDPVDIIEQVTDGQFAVQYLENVLFIPFTGVAAIGYSWGGLAAAILGMQDSLSSPLKAIISLDGTDRYPYGEDGAEDDLYSQIRRAPYFKPDNLKMPYLYLGRSRQDLDFVPDSVFVLGWNSQSRSTHYVYFPGTTHEDFSCLPFLASRLQSSLRPATTVYPLLNQLITACLDECTKASGSFEDTLQASLRSYPSQIALSEPESRKKVNASSLTLKGTVIDDLGKALPYVNIGVPSSNQGTVSRLDGSFSLVLKAPGSFDTLRFSLIGYSNHHLALGPLLSRIPNQPLQIQLKEQSQQLPAVSIAGKRLRRKTLGNRTESRFLSVGFGSNQLGAQVGIPIKARRHPMILEEVDFHVSYNRYDSLTVRLNIYQLEEGKPTHHLLNQSFILQVGSQTGRFAFDLSQRPFAIREDVLVALELLQGKGGADQGIFFSAGMLNGATYYRKASHGSWRKAKGMGVGIQVKVKY
jgi:hypothetical protein